MPVSIIDSSSKEKSTSLQCIIIKNLTNSTISNSFKRPMMSMRIIIRSSLLMNTWKMKLEIIMIKMTTTI